MRRIALALLTLTHALGCNDKPNPNPNLPPALQQPTAVASTTQVEPIDLIEGPLDVLGLRLPIGSRPLTSGYASVFDVPAPVEHVDRYLRARLTTEHVERALGGHTSYERARLLRPSASATGLPLRVVLRPNIAGTRLLIQEDATGLPASSAAPDTRELEIVIDQLKHRSESRGLAGPLAPNAPPGAMPLGPALQATISLDPADAQAPTPNAPQQPDDDDDDDDE
jgi:hypothetical protein